MKYESPSLCNALLKAGHSSRCNVTKVMTMSSSLISFEKLPSVFHSHFIYNWEMKTAELIRPTGGEYILIRSVITVDSPISKAQWENLWQCLNLLKQFSTHCISFSDKTNTFFPQKSAHKGQQRRLQIT